LIGCGLACWARRPQSRSGALLAAAGIAWFVPDLTGTGAGAPSWLGAHALYPHPGPLVQLVLTHPLGRIRGRLEGGAVVAGYVAAVDMPVWFSRAGTIAIAAVLVVLAARWYARAAGAERRMRRSALQATTLFASSVAAIAAARYATDTATLLG